LIEVLEVPVLGRSTAILANFIDGLPSHEADHGGNETVIVFWFDLPAAGNPMFGSWRRAKPYEGDRHAEIECA
jgi:hypothetical protein